MLRDITETKTARAALERSEELKSADDGRERRRDPDARQRRQIVELNRAAERLYKTTRAAVGESLETFVPWRDRQVWVEILDRLRSDPTHLRGRRLTGTGRRSDGSEFPLEATIDSLETAVSKCSSPSSAT